MNPKDPLRELKIEMLDKEANPRKMKLSEKTDDEKFFRLIGYLRFVAFEGDAEALKKVSHKYEGIAENKQR